jgi:hypothetical protein
MPVSPVETSWTTNLNTTFPTNEQVFFLQCCMVILLISTSCSSDEWSPSLAEPTTDQVSEVEGPSLSFEFTLADIPQRDGLLVFRDGAHLFATMDAFHRVPDVDKLAAMQQAGFDSYYLRYMENLEALESALEAENVSMYQSILRKEARFIKETSHSLDPEIGFKYYSALPFLSHEGLVYVGEAAYLFDSGMGQIISYEGDLDALFLAKETK